MSTDDLGGTEGSETLFSVRHEGPFGDCVTGTRGTDRIEGSPGDLRPLRDTGQ